MLESINIKNFKCLKGIHSLEFSEGIYSIKGKKDGDFSNSNRTGKTSFLEAIKFAMFKGSVSDTITEGQTDMFSELTINGVTLFSGSADTKVDGENVLVSQLKSISESILGIDYKMFGCTVGAFSDTMYGFLSLKPKEQKDFLLYYFCNSNVDWELAREYIQEKVRELSESKKEESKDFERIELVLKDINKDFYLNKLKELKYELSSKEQEYEITKESSDSLLNNYKAMLNRVAYLTESIKREETIKETIEKKENQKSELIEKRNTIQKELSNYKTLPGYDYKIKKIEKEITINRSKVNTLNNSVEIYEGSGGLCPILKQECPHKEGLNRFYLDSKEEIKDTLLNSETLKTEYTNLKDERKYVSGLTSQLNDVNNLIFSLSEDLESLISKNKSVPDMEKEASTLKEKIKFTESALNADKIENLINSISTLKVNIEKISSILLDFDIKSNELKRKDKLMYELNTKLNEYSTAAKLVSPKGLPHLLLNEVLTTFEMYINKFLSFFDMSVVVSGYSELKSLEDYCPNDGIKYNKNDIVCKVCGNIRGKKLDESISIISKDSGVEWWQESSGGRALIALAVRLALLKMIKNKKSDVDFIILDEVFSNLDSKNKVKVMNLIKFAMKDLELKQVFIVSHDELKEYSDYEIIIEHENEEIIIK